MSQLHSQIRTTRSYETEMLIKSLTNYVKQISNDMGKKVDLDINKFDANIIPYKYRLVVKDVLIQLIKNSIDHGIETPEEREFIGKPQWGIVSIACNEDERGFHFSVRDDGRGIDTEKLLSKLKDSKYMDKKKVGLSEQEIADMIFRGGISTKDDVTMISGRGVGLDAVKHKIEKYKGKIELKYKKGEFCEFNIVIPG
jgi:two-component system chemotaxis sensor kinase CheA